MNSTKSIILLTLLSNITPQFAENLFYDLHGVLLKTSKIRAFKKLGIEAIGNPRLKERLFEFMNSIDEDKSNNKLRFQGEKMPSFFCEWQKGEITAKQMVDFINREADENPDFFSSKTEQKLIKKSAEFFLPKNNIEIMKPSTTTIGLVKKCTKIKKKKKKCQNTVFLTSNFDRDAFELVKKQFPEVIELFDNDKLIISADIGCMKPEPDFYDYIVKRFNLNPKECYLIDDTIENVEGAKKYGINAIHYKNTRQVERELRKNNIL